MKRRQFIHLLSSVTASALLGMPGLPLSSALGQTSGSTGPLALSITSSFMEDRSTRVPISITGAATTYRSKDGTLNLFNVAGLRMLGMRPVLVRLAQKQDSFTGWVQDSVPLPMLQETFAQRGLPLSVSLAIVPGGDGPDRLLISRSGALYSARLAADGSLADPLSNMLTGGWISSPVSGLLPQGAAYLPEIAPAAPGFPAVFQLRAMTPYGPGAPVPADPNAFLNNLSGAAGPQLFPLRQSGQGFYRYVAHTPQGDLICYRLAVDPATGRFAIDQSEVLFDQVPAQCAALIEDTPGNVTLIFVDRAQRSKGAPRTVEPNKLYVYMMKGHYDPQGTGKVAWSAPVPIALDHAPESHGFELPSIEARTNPLSGVIDVLFMATRAYGDNSNSTEDERGKHPEGSWLYITGFDPRQQLWGPLEPIEHNGFPMGLSTQTPDFFLFRPSVGVEHWSHNADGELDREVVELAPDDATFVKTGCYRLGLTLTEGALPLGNEVYKVRATAPVRAVVGGRHVVISPTSPITARSGGDGTLWVEVLMQDYAQFPTLVFENVRFGKRLYCDLDSKARSFFRTISADTLREARDPADNSIIIANSDNADPAAQALREFASADAASIPNGGPPPITLSVTSDVPTSWVPLTQAATLARPLIRRGRPFRLTGEGGKLRFELLDAATAQSIHASFAPKAAAVSGGIRPMGFFDSVVDFFSDVGNAIADGAKTAFNFVYDGVKAGLEIVFDGLSYAFDFVLNTIEAVLDAINTVLDLVGFALGRGLRWLLKTLGFVFPWDRILERRDQFEQVIRGRITGFCQSLPDPVAAARDIGSRIDQIKATTLNGINSLRSRPESRQNFGSILSAYPSLIASLNGGSMNVMPQITWVIDKLAAVLLRSIGMAPLQLPGLDDAIADITGIVGPTDVANIFDIGSVMGGLLNGFDSFSTAIFDPILGMVANGIGAGFDLVSKLLGALGKILGILRDNATAIIDWLAHPLGKSFASGFWRGLMDEEFSFFSVACTLAAIVAEFVPVPSRSGSGVRAMGGGVRSMTAPGSGPAYDAAYYFQRVGCLTTFMASTVGAATPKTDAGALDIVSNAFTALDLVCKLGFMVSTSWQGTEEKTSVIMTSAITLACVVIGIPYKLSSGGTRGKIRLALLVLNFLASIGLLLYAVIKGKFATFYLILNTIGNGLAILVEVKRPLDGYTSLFYGGVQGGLAYGRTTLYESA